MYYLHHNAKQDGTLCYDFITLAPAHIQPDCLQVLQHLKQNGGMHERREGRNVIIDEIRTQGNKTKCFYFLVWVVHFGCGCVDCRGCQKKKALQQKA